MRPHLPALAVHPLLFAAYAVLFIYAHNIQQVRVSEVTSPLFWSVLGASVVLAITTLILRDVQGAALVTSALVVGFFGYGHLASVLDPSLGGWMLFAGWLAFLAVVSVPALLRRRRLGAITGGLNMAGGVLLLFALSTIVPYQLQAAARAVDTNVAPSGLTAERATQRDIFYLVPDRYGSSSALEMGPGITDNDLPNWLSERGFQVAARSHANYGRTVLSMAAVLNLGYLDELAERMGRGNGDYAPLYDMLQEHVVGRFLREQGYRYVHIGSWFNPTRSARIADENLESDSTTEFRAVLDETTALPLFTSLLPEEEAMPPADEKHVEHARFQFRALRRLIDEPGPKFVLAHVLLPHDPYTFDAEGRYVSVSKRQGMSVRDQFAGQLEYTNTEIRRVIERLLARPESEQPIIILQADEGPYPARYAADQVTFDWAQATAAELETKHGILNAVYLPPEPDQPAELPEPYPTMTSVNTFRMVFERYFGVSLPYLEDRIYSVRNHEYPYDLTEVTDRLATH